MPGTHRDYWVPKLQRNVTRDGAALASLAAAGWGVLVLWECEVGDSGVLARRLRDFLATPTGGDECL